MKRHKGAILSAQCSMHYIVSSAEDGKMCTWSRRTGNLVHVNYLDPGACTALSLLGRNWCVTGGKGSLCLWDIRSGELIRRFPIAPRSIVQPTIEHIYVSSDLCVVCLLGHELYVVKKIELATFELSHFCQSRNGLFLYYFIFIVCIFFTSTMFVVSCFCFNISTYF